MTYTETFAATEHLKRAEELLASSSRSADVSFGGITDLFRRWFVPEQLKEHEARRELLPEVLRAEKLRHEIEDTRAEKLRLEREIRSEQKKGEWNANAHARDPLLWYKKMQKDGERPGAAGRDLEDPLGRRKYESAMEEIYQEMFDDFNGDSWLKTIEKMTINIGFDGDETYIRSRESFDCSPLKWMVKRMIQRSTLQIDTMFPDTLVRRLMQQRREDLPHRRQMRELEQCNLLIWSAYCSNVVAVEICLGHGADPNVGRGLALSCAVWRLFLDTENADARNRDCKRIVDLLLDEGADPNLLDDECKRLIEKHLESDERDHWLGIDPWMLHAPTGMLIRTEAANSLVDKGLILEGVPPIEDFSSVVCASIEELREARKNLMRDRPTLRPKWKTHLPFRYVKSEWRREDHWNIDQHIWTDERVDVIPKEEGVTWDERDESISRDM